MTSKLLSSLKAWQLKYASFLVGAPSTGTKAELEAAILARLKTPTIPNMGGRVLSIDMGIRNLAFSVVNVPVNTLSNSKDALKTPLGVAEWQRMNVLNRASVHISELDRQIADALPTEDENATLKEIAPLAAAAFAPSSLSKTAHGLAREFLAYKPDVILIERQRHRSQGGSAVQEWTVRVNSLEAMLWACFETMRELSYKTDSKDKFPPTYAVEPRKVARFWMAASEHSLVPDEGLLKPETKGDFTLSAKKVDKKDRVAILKSWIDGASSGSHNQSEAASGRMYLDFTSSQSRDTASLFSSKLSKTKSESKSAAKREPLAKLDDLTDCTLQAAAWVRWEQNRRTLSRLLLDKL